MLVLQVYAFRVAQRPFPTKRTAGVWVSPLFAAFVAA